MAASARFERREGIARNTAFSFGVQLATSVFTAALTLYLVRALGPHGYGLFALALAVTGLVSIPADLGITGSTGRYVAEARTNRAAAARVVADALVLKAVASAATSLALFATAGWIADGYGEPDLVWPLRGVAVALFGHSVMTLVRGVFVALGRISVNLRLVLSESAVETAASVGLVLLGAGATGAAFGRAIGYGFGAAFGVTLVALTLGTPRARAPRVPLGAREADRRLRGRARARGRRLVRLRPGRRARDRSIPGSGRRRRLRGPVAVRRLPGLPRPGGGERGRAAAGPQRRRAAGAGGVRRRDPLLDRRAGDLRAAARRVGRPDRRTPARAGLRGSRRRPPRSVPIRPRLRGRAACSRSPPTTSARRDGASRSRLRRWLSISRSPWSSCPRSGSSGLRSPPRWRSRSTSPATSGSATASSGCRFVRSS